MRTAKQSPLQEISIVACIGAGWAEAAEIRTLVTGAVKMCVRHDAIDP